MTARALPLVCAVALAACALGAVLSWTAFLRSWLTAAITWGALPLGAVAVLMTHGLTGGAWGRSSRPVWLAMAATMPLFVAAMVPLLFGLDELFSWTQPTAELPEVVQRKRAYLNEPFFLLRSVVYFAIWLSLPWLLGTWRTRARRIYAPGLILWVLTLTFFGFDWLMSLEPTFYSDVYGLTLMTGAVTTAFAFGLLLMPAAIAPGVRQDLANLWLTALLGWAFMAFAQLIVIWSGNLPHEIEWYLHRQAPPWRVVNGAALALYLLLPFAVLLSTAAKRSRGWMRATAAACLAGHLLYVQWLVLPAFGQWLPAQTWLDPAALIALGGGFLWLTGRHLQRSEHPHG